MLSKSMARSSSMPWSTMSGPGKYGKGIQASLSVTTSQAQSTAMAPARSGAWWTAQGRSRRQIAWATASSDAATEEDLEQHRIDPGRQRGLPAREEPVDEQCDHGRHGRRQQRDQTAAVTSDPLAAATIRRPRTVTRGINRRRRGCEWHRSSPDSPAPGDQEFHNPSRVLAAVGHLPAQHDTGCPARSATNAESSRRGGGPPPRPRSTFRPLIQSSVTPSRSSHARLGELRRVGGRVEQAGRLHLVRREVDALPAPGHARHVLELARSRGR